MIILGALLTASNLGAKITGTGFIAFTLGSILWLAIGLVSGPSSLIWQNIILTLLNAFGIWRWLGRRRIGRVIPTRKDQPRDPNFDKDE